MRLTIDLILFLCTEGYGQVLINRIRQVKKKCFFRPTEFPLILGRDFVGEVVSRGTDVVAKDMNVGDTVVGVVAPYDGQGCHSEFVIVPETQVKKKKINYT